jgi:hypothetical protein
MVKKKSDTHKKGITFFLFKTFLPAWWTYEAERSGLLTL